MYQNVFVGSDAVTTLVHSGVADSREVALRIGQALLASGMFHHVFDDHTFRDEWLFYRFYVDEVDIAVGAASTFYAVLPKATSAQLPVKLSLTSRRQCEEAGTLQLPLPIPRSIPWRFPAHVWCNSVLANAQWADAFHAALSLRCPVRLAAQLALLRRSAWRSVTHGDSSKSGNAIAWQGHPSSMWVPLHTRGGVTCERLQCHHQPGDPPVADSGARGVTHFTAYRSSVTIPLPLPITGALITNMRSRVQWDPMCTFAQAMGPAFQLAALPDTSTSDSSMMVSADGAVTSVRSRSTTEGSGGHATPSVASTPPAPPFVSTAATSSQQQSTHAYPSASVSGSGTPLHPLHRRSSTHGPTRAAHMASRSAGASGDAADVTAAPPTLPPSTESEEEALLSQKWGAWFKGSALGRALGLARPPPEGAAGGPSDVDIASTPPGSPAHGAAHSPSQPRTPLFRTGSVEDMLAGRSSRAPACTVSDTPFSSQVQSAAAAVLGSSRLLYRRMQAVSIMGSMRDTPVLQDVFMPPRAWAQAEQGGPAIMEADDESASQLVREATGAVSQSQALLVELSVKHRMVSPIKGFRRADIMALVYRLQSTSDGAGTHVTLLSQMHLAGNMPMWAHRTVREFQTAQPLQQLLALSQKLASGKAFNGAAAGAKLTRATEASGTTASHPVAATQVTASPWSMKRSPQRQLSGLPEEGEAFAVSAADSTVGGSAVDGQPDGVEGGGCNLRAGRVPAPAPAQACQWRLA